VTDGYFQLEFRQQDHWPPLAWLATCCTGRSSVIVEHGIGVETRSDWFAEAVWDGAFEKGNFDDTDLIFGSGGQLRETGVTFVPSSSTIDRLQFVSSGDSVLVSNSLPCLLEACGASVELQNQSYFPYLGRTTIVLVPFFRGQWNTRDSRTERLNSQHEYYEKNRARLEPGSRRTAFDQTSTRSPQPFVCHGP